MHHKIATLGTNQRCREKINEVCEWFVDRITAEGGSYTTPKLDVLAKEIDGISANTLGKYLKQLVRLGLLTVDKRYNKKWRYARYSLPMSAEELLAVERRNYHAALEAIEEVAPLEKIGDSIIEKAEEPRPEQQEAVEEVSEVELVPYIEGHSQLIRAERVMLDCDVGNVYSVSTREINQARNNNPVKFTDPTTGRLFAFQLNDDETKEVIKNFDNLADSFKFRPSNPWVYTQEGCNMLATILKSEKAVLRAIQIVKVFTDLERMAHGEEPKQPGFAEMLTAVASGFGVLRGELDTKVSLPVFEGEKQRLLAGIDELGLKVHQTTVRDDNFQRELEGYRKKLEDTTRRLMEEKVERLKMQEERRRQAELRRLYQYGQIYGAMIGNRAKGGGFHAVWKMYIKTFGYPYRDTPLEVLPERIERMKNNIIAYNGEHPHAYHNLCDSDKIFLAFEGVMDFQQLQIRF